MSTDRTTEILNYLSAISREVGEFRQELRDFRTETNARLEKIEREQRQTTQRLEAVWKFTLKAMQLGLEFTL